MIPLKDVMLMMFPGTLAGLDVALASRGRNPADTKYTWVQFDMYALDHVRRLIKEGPDPRMVLPA